MMSYVLSMSSAIFTKMLRVIMGSWNRQRMTTMNGFDVSLRLRKQIVQRVGRHYLRANVIRGYQNLNLYLFVLVRTPLLGKNLES